MLINLGQRPAADDLLGLLLDCHTRIRTFSALAVDLGRREGLPAHQVEQACDRCARYFSEALPLHVADEEVSLLPRLSAGRAEVQAALASMHGQHQEHEAPLRALLAALSALRASPGDAALRARLLEVATPLAAAFEEHLQLEEKHLFPALDALLSPQVQAEVVAEVRARRSPRT
jgi:hemerythrin-like domain-containing protein